MTNRRPYVVLGLALWLGVSLLTWPLEAQDRPGGGASNAEAPAGSSEDAPGRALFEEPDRCEDCHIEASWEVIVAPDEGFDHATTGFPLRNAHAALNCDDCHRGGLDALTATCTGCHLDPHAGSYTLACEQCHSDRTWDVPRNPVFHEQTRFPLTGVHASLRCEACHRRRRGEPAALIPTDCIVCHVEDFQRAEPSHVVASGFTECGQCHNTSTWRGARYRHELWELEAAHGRARCNDCHDGLVFNGLAQGGQDCLECHRDEYNSTAALNLVDPTIPDHPASNFPSSCAPCHPNADPPNSFMNRFRPN